MTIQDLINFGVKKLSKTSNSAVLDSEVLLSYVLNKPKLDIFVHMDKNVHKLQMRKFFDLLKKRSQGWPVAYLVKEKEFYKLKFYVDKNVLIPRPETEGLVELAVTYIKRSHKIGTDRNPLRILDIGTGSGNIIISLAKSLYNLSPITYNLFASDISPKALAVAKKNAKIHKVKITFKQGSLHKPWNNQNFDIIVANLPYLAKRTDVSTKFEPTKALIAKNKGLELFEELFKQIAHLRTVRSSDRTTKQSKPLSVFVEIGHDQGPDIKKLAKKYMSGFKIEIVKDLSNRIRFLCLSANNSD